MNSAYERAINAAGLSLIYPGLGQALQGRRVMATWLAVGFTGLLAAGRLQPHARVVWWTCAIALGVYAIVDAYWHDRPRTIDAGAI